MFVFPAGTVLSSGGTLSIGTRSSSEPGDLFWDDKKVVHRKKTDVIDLYDRQGRLVDRLDNQR